MIPVKSVRLNCGRSVLFLKNNNRRCWVAAIPLGGKVAVSTGKPFENYPCLPRQMRLCFTRPELEAFTRLNPARGRADIDNDELNRPTSEEASDVVFGERSDPCRGLESIMSPQLSER